MSIARPTCVTLEIHNLAIEYCNTENSKHATNAQLLQALRWVSGRAARAAVRPVLSHGKPESFNLRCQLCLMATSMFYNAR